MASLNAVRVRTNIKGTAVVTGVKEDIIGISYNITTLSQKGCFH